MAHEAFEREVLNLRDANRNLLEDVGETSFFFFIVTKWAGKPLSQIGRFLTDCEALDVGIALVSSLKELHNIPIVHSDIKPGNVVLPNWGEDGQLQARLIDWEGAIRPMIGPPNFSTPVRSRAGCLGCVLRFLRGATDYFSSSPKQPIPHGM